MEYSRVCDNVGKFIYLVKQGEKKGLIYKR